MDMWNRSVLIWRKKGREKTICLSSKTSLSAWDSLTECCLPWWKALFIFLSGTTLTSCRDGICRRSQLRLMDYVKYAEDVWETDIFCLTWTRLEIKPIQADRQSDDFADTLESTTVMVDDETRKTSSPASQIMSGLVFVVPDMSVNFMGLTFKILGQHFGLKPNMTLYVNVSVPVLLQVHTHQSHFYTFDDFEHLQQLSL